MDEKAIAIFPNEPILKLLKKKGKTKQNRHKKNVNWS